MKLPNNDNVLIPKEKLVNYILSEIHVTGKFKAKFFRNLGFNETNIHLFEKALRKVAKYCEVAKVISSPYGTKYILDGKIDTPKGKSVIIRTIWITEKIQTRPRLVTLYPV